MNKSCKVSVMRTLNLLVYNVNCDIVAILPLVFPPPWNGYRNVVLKFKMRIFYKLVI